jgi:hypothetical protein
MIDEAGREMPDFAATRPMSDRDVLFNGKLLGDELLLRSVNHIGEPTATMFRRSDVSLLAGALFKIDCQEYTCLADLALWLRLLAKGSMAYLSQTLSFIRQHSDRLQGTEIVAAQCQAERYYLPTDARSLGFLEREAEFQAASAIGIDLVRRGLLNEHLSAEARVILVEAQKRIDSDAARERPG